MAYDNFNGTVLKIEGTYYHVNVENEGTVTNVKNTTPIQIEVGDKVIVSYVETPNNPVITGVYNKTASSSEGTGFFKFELKPDGHLYCVYQGDTAPDMRLNDEGHLIYNY